MNQGAALGFEIFPEARGASPFADGPKELGARFDPERLEASYVGSITK